MANPSNNPAGRPPKDPYSAKALEKKEIEEILAEMPRGYRAQVTRLEPEWCKGYQGEMHVDSGETMSLETIKSRFGGEKLRIQIVDEQGKYRASRTVNIAEVPKKDYEILSPNYTSPMNVQNMLSKQNGSQQQQYSFGMPFSMAGMPGMPGATPGQMPPMPPAMYMKVLEKMWGWEEPKKETSSLEMMQQKMMMDIMTSQSNMQAENFRIQMENNREMLKMRQEAAKKTNPEDDLSGVSKTLAIMKEIKGMREMMGDDGKNVTTEIVGATANLLETAVGELIDLKKMQMTAMATQSAGAQTTAAPPMPQRVTTPPPQTSSPVSGSSDPIQLAKDMRRMYQNLSFEDQQRVMEAFLSDDNADEYQSEDLAESENFVDGEKKHEQSLEKNLSSVDNNTICRKNLLDPEDQAVLDADDNKSPDIQNSEYTGTA